MRLWVAGVRWRALLYTERFGTVESTADDATVSTAHAATVSTAHAAAIGAAASAAIVAAASMPRYYWPHRLARVV